MICATQELSWLNIGRSLWFPEPALRSSFQVREINFHNFWLILMISFSGKIITCMMFLFRSKSWIYMGISSEDVTNSFWVWGHIRVYPKWSKTFIEFSEFSKFRECDISMNMNWGQFKDLIYCLWFTGAVVALLSVTQKRDSYTNNAESDSQVWIGPSQTIKIFSRFMKKQLKQLLCRKHWRPVINEGWYVWRCEPRLTSITAIRGSFSTINGLTAVGTWCIS